MAVKGVAHTKAAEGVNDGEDAGFRGRRSLMKSPHFLASFIWVGLLIISGATGRRSERLTAEAQASARRV
jgi:hypothetical protein